MSDISKCSKPISKPKAVKELKEDVFISQQKQEHIRQETFKWFIFVLLITGISCIFVLFIYNLFSNSQLQDYILQQLKNNIVFIVVSSFAILRFKLPDNNKWS